MRQTLKALLLMLCVLAMAFSAAACGEEQSSEKTVVAVPVIEGKAYNGQTQIATVAESDDYDVTVNRGGTDVGEYDVVLTLKNTDKTKWETPDADNEANVTLKFAVTKATNEITSLTLAGWTAGSEPGTPEATAKFGTPAFTYASEENGTYTETVPVNAGTYFVKASVAGTNNYEGAEKTIAFEIGKTPATVATAPAAIPELVVNDDLSGQVLVTAGAANGGVMVYALAEGEETEPSQGLPDPDKWSAELPQAGKAGKYTVYYRVKGDENHSDSEYGKVVVEISKKANVVSDFVVADIKYGETPSPAATVSNGTPVFSYSLTEDGEYAAWADIAGNAGEYFVKATVEETDVYLGVTEIRSFTVNKADNAIPDFTVAQIKCHEMPELTAAATAGTAVAYKYATKENGEYTDLTAETELSAGTYWVKAYTAGDENYVGAESKAAELTVNHELVWDTTDAAQDAEKCVCGHTGRTFDKTITEKNAQRVELNVTVEDGNVTADEYAYSVLSLDGISGYASVESIKFGEKTITVNTFADEDELAGNKIAVNVKDFGLAYGERNVVVTVRGEEGDTHEVNVKVLLVTAILKSKADLNNFGTMAKACEEEKTAWGGYFELGADIDYNDYWNDFFKANSIDELKAMKGFIGVFDGRGYNVKGLYVTRKSAVNNGSFITKLGTNGVIRNISFTNARVGNDRSLLVYGGSGLIENVFVKYSVFGATDYDDYNKGHNWGQTTTMFARGEENGAVVRNVIIDVSECVGVAKQVEGVAGYVLGQFNNIETFSNVYIIGASEEYTRLVRDIAVSVETKTETDFAPGTRHFVYKSFVEMANDTERDYSGFTAPLWINKEGGLPYVKAQNIAAPVFVTTVSEIAKGNSAQFIVSANATLALDEAAIAAGITLENGRIGVPAGIADASFVLTATSIFDPTLRTETTFSVINAREYKTLSKLHEIDLDVSGDGSVNSAKTAEIDLTEEFVGNATVSLVKVGDEVVDGYNGVEIVAGKVVLNVAGFGIGYYGNKELKLVFESGGTDFEYIVPVLFVTKTIMNGDENVRAIKTLVTALQGGGYYRLGENIKMKEGWFTTSVDYRIGVDHAFAGTLDGQGYSLSGLRLSSWDKGGFIQKLAAGGVVKNIAFLDVRIGAAAALIYSGSGTIENVYVKISAMPANGTGEYASAGWRGNETTVFGCRLEKNAFTVKNVFVDFSATSSDISAYSDKAYAKIFGTFDASAKIENAVATGIAKAVSDKVTDSSAVYVAYTDGTDNGVTFPANGWNETYWTVSGNTVTWKMK